MHIKLNQNINALGTVAKRIPLRLTFKKSKLSQGQILAIFAACFELCSFLWLMLPMLTIQKFVKNIILTDKLSIIVTELFCR